MNTDHKPKYVASCNTVRHPAFVHDCNTFNGSVLYVPPGWEWTGQPDGSIVRKAVKKNG